MSGPRYRAICYRLIKLTLRKFHKMFQPGQSACGKRRLFGHRRAAVPRTNLLADVASEDVPAHPVAMLLRNRASQLDREVRNAAPRIQRPLPFTIQYDRFRRTRVDASRARPAAVRRWTARLQLQRRHDLAQKKPRPQRLMNQARILPDPSQARLSRVTSFQQRRRIDADFIFERTRLALQKLH